MTSASWTEPGGSLSHKNACREYGLDENEIFDAIKDGKIQFKVNYAHGNPYYKVLRLEIEKLANEIHGEDHINKYKIKNRINKINSEMRSLKRKIKLLEKEKHELEKECLPSSQ